MGSQPHPHAGDGRVRTSIFSPMQVAMVPAGRSSRVLSMISSPKRGSGAPLWPRPPAAVPQAAPSPLQGLAGTSLPPHHHFEKSRR